MFFLFVSSSTISDLNLEICNKRKKKLCSDMMTIANTISLLF